MSEAQLGSTGWIFACPRGLNWGFSSCRDPNHPRQQEMLVSRMKDSQMETTLQWGSHVHHLPTTAYTGRPNPDACRRGTVSRDSAPQWSLSPITQLGMSVSFKIEKEIDVGFTFIPHHLQKSICWPVSVSIHFCLDLRPSWDWRADRESTNPFPMVPCACSYTALIDWVSCGLGAEKN